MDKEGSIVKKMLCILFFFVQGHHARSVIPNHFGRHVRVKINTSISMPAQKNDRHPYYTYKFDYSMLNFVIHILCAAEKECSESDEGNLRRHTTVNRVLIQRTFHMHEMRENNGKRISLFTRHLAIMYTQLNFEHISFH